MAKLRSLFNGDNYQQYLDFCAQTGLPYTIIESNYTLEIQSDFCNIYFMQNVMNKKAFIAGAKIKRDIKLTGLKKPEINNSDLRYFNFNEIALPLINKPVYCIDIKSAYANVLKNSALITDNTFKYMANLDKKDRLACVGMLASKKDHFNMVGNDCIDTFTIRNENENFFYYCVDTTHRIMNLCKKEIGHDFLFFWVDGIFFQGAENIPIIQRILTEKGYKYSLDGCSEFQFIDTDTEKKIIYYKNEEKKEVFLPKRNNEIDHFLINFLNLHPNKETNIFNQSKKNREL